MTDDSAIVVSFISIVIFGIYWYFKENIKEKLIQFVESFGFKRVTDMESSRTTTEVRTAKSASEVNTVKSSTESEKIRKIFVQPAITRPTGAAAFVNTQPVAVSNSVWPGATPRTD